MAKDDDAEIAAQEVAKTGDHRTAREVLRQYERLRIVQGRLVRSGVLNDGATPEEVIDKLRQLIPADIL